MALKNSGVKLEYGEAVLKALAKWADTGERKPKPIYRTPKKKVHKAKWLL